MSASRKKRLAIVAVGTVAAAAIYLGAYFACVSVQFRYGMEAKVRSIGRAHAYYKVPPALDDIADSFFEPARLFDAYYLRPQLWEDR
jgi:hypothetical protein